MARELQEDGEAACELEGGCAVLKNAQVACFNDMANDTISGFLLVALAGGKLQDVHGAGRVGDELDFRHGLAPAFRFLPMR